MPDENERHQNVDETAVGETAGQETAFNKRPGTRSWLAQLKDEFPEVFWLSVDWRGEERCFNYIKVHLRREPAREKDAAIEKCLRESILRPMNQRCKEVLFARE